VFYQAFFGLGVVAFRGADRVVKNEPLLNHILKRFV
jgi:hypothetical protein